MIRRPRCKRSRGVPAALALLLYLVGTAAVPLVHAETEVLHLKAGFESGHSDGCPRIHSDATCLLVTSYQVAGGTDRAGFASRLPVPVDEFPAAPGHQLRSLEHTTLRVRAPPSL